jgi:Kef-type K+ transport system membrane component KefB
LNEILGVGLILISALITGHVAQLLRAPEVTGYLLVGVLIGPATFDLISHDYTATLSFLSDVARGLILFNIGAIFEAGAFRQLGPGVVRITLWEASLAFVLVFLVLVSSGTVVPLAPHPHRGSEDDAGEARRGARRSHGLRHREAEMFDLKRF